MTKAYTSFLFLFLLLQEIALASKPTIDFKAIDIMTSLEEQHRWLYERIFVPEVRNQQPSETFKSFRVHLQDSLQTFPDPDLIQHGQLKDISSVSGTITYVSIVKKKYAYDILKVNDTSVLNVRIHLQNATAIDKAKFQEKLDEAQLMWNTHRVLTSFNYEFKFEIVEDRSKSHFSVLVLDETRGPYDTFWSRKWTGTVIAHEMGHMLGLGDEYQTISEKSDCWEPSLMCDSSKGKMMPHHYYFVLRRIIH